MEKPQLPASTNRVVPYVGTEASPPYGDHAYGYSSVDVREPRSLAEYWAIVRRHRISLIIITLFGGLAGLLFTLPQNPLYQARTTLEIQDFNDTFLNIQQVNPVSEPSSSAAPNEVRTQIKLLESPGLIKRVLTKLEDRIPEDLKPAASQSSTGRKESAVLTFKDRIVKAANRYIHPQAPATSQEPATSAKTDPPVKDSTSAAQAQRANRRTSATKPKTDQTSAPKTQVEGDRLEGVDIRRAASNLRIRVSPQTRIVEASYDSTDPGFAAAFLNTLSQEFIQSNMEARWKTSEQTGQWLSRQLDEMRGKLEQSEDALQSYARKAGLLFRSDKTNISEEKLRQLQDELSKAQSDRIATQSRWEAATGSTADTLPDALSNATLQSLQEKITELRRERAQLITVYTEKHSKVSRIDAQVAPLEEALQKERSAIVERIRNAYRTAQNRERLLAQYYAAQSRLVTDQSEKAIQYNILNREVESNRAVYETMLQRAKEASIASAMRASNIRIVDAAEPPGMPYKPSIPLNAALGLLSGLFLGLAIVFVSERNNRTLREPGESRLWLNVPELQVIPAAEIEGSRRLPRNSSSLSIRPQLQPGAANRTNGSGNDPGSLPVELVSWQQRPSLIADSFRSLLTSILLSGEDADWRRVLVVTSASPREGKTTVATNLAIALAKMNRKVLIVDADLRKPRIHEVLALENRAGLSTLLTEQYSPADAMNGFIQQTRIPGLFALPSGPVRENTGNALYGKKISLLLAKFRQDFDMVIIDTPPMLNMPDARMLGRMADGVILVTRAGQTVREAAAAANLRFAEDGTRMLGTVLNAWDPRKSDHPYGYSHYGYYQRS